MMRLILPLFLVLVSVLPAAAGEHGHALAMNGRPKYGPDFTHFDYVGPRRPQGRAGAAGRHRHLRQLQPLHRQGQLPPTAWACMFDTLTEQSLDEPFTEYGLLAESIELAPDRSSLTFRLRERGHGFTTAAPVTAADVAFTFRILVEQGNPHYAQYYADVERVEVGRAPRS